MNSSFLVALPTLVGSPRVARAIGARLVGTEDGAAIRGDVRISIETRSEPVAEHNVGCLLPGHETDSAAVVFTAHYDHLGVAEPDAPGDSIYNGFSDNAAGVAMLLAIAASLRDEPLRHSALFLFFTGEERGLLGSDAFAANPAWPLSRMLGLINLDAGAPPAPPTTWELAGAPDSHLGSLATTVAEERGWTVRPSHARPNSDYYPFWRNGVETVFVIPGTGPYDGLSVDQSAELKRRWDRYHRPDDEWAGDFPFAGLARYAAYALLISRALDESASRGFSGSNR